MAHGNAHRSLTSYIRALSSLKPLERDEEHRLALEYQRTGARDVADRLVRGHLRLVVKIAQEFRWSGHDLLDLIEEGNLGLLLSLKKYDPTRGVRLSSYGALWVRATILHFVARNRRLVRIGTTAEQRRVMSRLRAERTRFEQLGITPDIAMLAERLDVPADGLAELEQHMNNAEVALAAPTPGDEHVRRLTGLPAPPDARPDRQLEQAEHEAHLRRTTRAFLRTLAPRDRQFFRARWLSEDPPTLQAMGVRFGVSRERARQLEARLLDRFRSFAEAQQVDAA
jgi:RNA polymerase sigma-32 factor